jgi:thiamine biosynthesis lipoprotein
MIEFQERPGGVLAACFFAMGCPCEILLALPAASGVAGGEEAARWLRPGVEEAWRIERKFSRYRDDSAVAAINASEGRAVAVDEETGRLLDYAAHCFELSGGLFDVTSGVLRRAWTFDGSDRVPEPGQVEALRARVGFARLERRDRAVVLPPGMEVDLGGIAKEYAVDCALEALERAACAAAPGQAPPALLVNFGGDLRANRAPGAQPWQVGVEDPARGPTPALVLELTRGALATSGDAHRFVMHGGVRYGHILDPRSGWPVADAPHSVTVAAPTCIEAGTLSTIALLQGKGAEAFLDDLGVRYWCLR